MVSLDCSTRCTGMAVWENDKYKTSHVIDLSKNKDIDKRIIEMSKLLWSGLDYYSPTSVYIEDTYCGGNPDTQKKLNRVQGVVFSWCLQNNAQFVLLAPSTWRKYIPDFPNGKSVKRPIQKAFSVQYVSEHYDTLTDTLTDDESDAILIGEAAIRMKEKDT